MRRLTLHKCIHPDQHTTHISQTHTLDCWQLTKPPQSIFPYDLWKHLYNNWSLLMQSINKHWKKWKANDVAMKGQATQERDRRGGNKTRTERWEMKTNKDVAFTWHRRSVRSVLGQRLAGSNPPCPPLWTWRSMAPSLSKSTEDTSAVSQTEQSLWPWMTVRLMYWLCSKDWSRLKTVAYG